MAKRYGRNQRRQHREEIARLTAELEYLRYGPFERAREGDPVIDPAWVAEETETRRKSRDRHTEYEMDLRLTYASGALMRAFRDHEPVAWRGLSWIVTDCKVASIHAEMFDYIAGHASIEIRLVAVARRGLSLAYILKHDKDRRFI